MLFLGVFQIGLPYGLVFWAEQYVSSGLAAILFATMPFFVVILAHILVDEKLTGLKGIGVVVSFIGLVLIFWRDLLSQGLAVEHFPLRWLGGSWKCSFRSTCKCCG